MSLKTRLTAGGKVDQKPSLYNQGQAIERLMYLIDNAPGELEDDIVNEFKNLRENISSGVDHAVFRLAAIDMYHAEAKREADLARERVVKLERAKESYERYILACVRSVSFPLKGTHGEFSLKTNPGRVDLSVPVTASKSFSNILPEGIGAEVEQRFLEKVEFFRIRKDEVAKALKAGEVLPFATLVKEQSLCLKKLKPLLS
jgi:hypothetical protein